MMTMKGQSSSPAARPGAAGLDASDPMSRRTNVLACWKSIAPDIQ